MIEVLCFIIYYFEAGNLKLRYIPLFPLLEIFNCTQRIVKEKRKTQRGISRTNLTLQSKTGLTTVDGCTSLKAFLSFPELITIFTDKIIQAV